MPQNIKHMIVNTVQVFNIYNKNNLQHFSIFYYISIFSFQKCVCKWMRCLQYIPYLFSSRYVHYVIVPIVLCMLIYMRYWLIACQTKTKDHKEKHKEKDSNKDMMAALKEEEMEEIDQKDDGYIELVLRVLARMCDGQHCGLQVSYNKTMVHRWHIIIRWLIGDI